jgi:hypothetical protein
MPAQRAGLDCQIRRILNQIERSSLRRFMVLQRPCTSVRSLQPEVVGWDKVASEEEVGLFEQYPWLLVPIIIVTVEAWSAVKSWVKNRYLQRERI